MTNRPEKIHFDRIMQVEQTIRENKDDLKALWQSAKDALEKDDVKLLKVAVKRALADQDKLREARETEDEADRLRHALGALADSPLGEAAMANVR